MENGGPTVSTRPFLTIYVAWHPKFEQGADLARFLYEHYRRKLYENVAGGTGVPVVYRSEPPSGSAVPIDVDLDTSETSAVVILIDKTWTSDPQWIGWAQRVSKQTDDAGLKARLFPVAIDATAIAVEIAEQAVRWDKWEADDPDIKQRRLLTGLSYQFCRMLRSYLEHLERPAEPEEELIKFLKRVEIFLSHSKHDENGADIALLVREFLQDGGYDAFFDVFDIPIGLRFNKVLLEKVRVSAVVAIHTDSYSSREWCRREMIEAKRFNVPLVVANCIRDVDERGFPYMANVPIIRMDPVERDRIDVIVCRLMDEVLKDFLWRCWIRVVAVAAGSEVAFLPRPPELIALTCLKGRTPPASVLVYPDPPIGAEEMALFDTAAPSMKLLSATEFIAGVSA
jgi:hypothetical protein